MIYTKRGWKDITDNSEYRMMLAIYYTDEGTWEDAGYYVPKLIELISAKNMTRQANISISNGLLTLSLSTLQNAPITPEMRQLGEDITKLLSGK